MSASATRIGSGTVRSPGATAVANALTARPSDPFGPIDSNDPISYIEASA